MTLDELNEQFDSKISLLMSEYMKGSMEFVEYDMEMFRLGEWYDEVKKEIDEKSS